MRAAGAPADRVRGNRWWSRWCLASEKLQMRTGWRSPALLPGGGHCTAGTLNGLVGTYGTCTGGVGPALVAHSAGQHVSGTSS